MIYCVPNMTEHNGYCMMQSDADRQRLIIMGWDGWLRYLGDAQLAGGQLFLVLVNLLAAL